MNRYIMSSLQEKLSKARTSKSFMTRLLVWIMILIMLLYFFWWLGKRSEQILIGTGIVAATALGLEIFDYDIDLWTLRETGDIQASRIENKKWVKLIGKCLSDDLNCAHFATQWEAQALYNACARQIEANNTHVDDAKRIDVYGLDGDKDGIVCEHLPTT